MRIALHQTGDVALRAGRTILAERDLLELGLVDARPTGDDRRISVVTDLADYDVVVTDSDEPGAIVEQALDRETNCVLWKNVDTALYDAAFSSIGRTLVVGSNLSNGITPSLAAHETAAGGEVMDVTTAWTEPGRPIRRGEAIEFPAPVGALWARPSSKARPNAMVAPTDSPWAGGIARVTSAGTTGVSTRIVGVADDAIHLEGLALATGAIAVAQSAYSPGLHHPDDAAERFLEIALRAGLDVAAYTLHNPD